MGYYQYKGVNASGRVTRGLVSAETFEGAKAQLKELKIELISLNVKTRVKEKKITAKDFLAFVSDMQTLMQAGLPIYEALLTLEEKYQSGKMYLLYAFLASSVKRGEALSKALTAYDPHFDPVYITMLAAGEESGSLEKCFKALKTLIERRQNLSQRVLSAMAYPLFLAGFCLLIGFMLFFYLIPTMKELLVERQVNGLTASVIGISDFLVDHSFYVASFVATLTLGLTLFLKSYRGKTAMQKLGMRLPLASSLLKAACLSRFCLVLGVLLKGGVPFIKALDLGRNVMKNGYFEEVILRAKQSLVEGRKLSNELRKERFMPPLFVRVVSVAEESGEMPAMMEKLGVIYEKELTVMLMRLVSLIQPLMLIILGIIVAIILLSVLLPLSDMNIAI